MCEETSDDVLSELKKILEKIPRPNVEELEHLYDELDELAIKVGHILISSPLYERKNGIVRFDKADEEMILQLIKKDNDVMVPFFITLCGLSVREMKRLYGVEDVYGLRHTNDEEKLRPLANAIATNLKCQLYLETVIYKFYKNWEEHQKRHYRGRIAEQIVRRELQKHGYRAGKVRFECMGKNREIDIAIPPDKDPQKLRVAILVRSGVRRDLSKRAKEFSSEFDETQSCFPNTRFVIIYVVSPSESNRLQDIRRVIIDERAGKKPYDHVMVVVGDKNGPRLDGFQELLEKLEEWGVPRYRNSGPRCST
jgi:hypothetical protein